MEVAAIILIGDLPQDCNAGANGRLATLAGTPLVLQDVLGRPVVHRIVELLQKQGVGKIAVVSEHEFPPGTPRAESGPAVASWQLFPPEQLWRGAENAFNDLAQGGADEILFVRPQAYIQIDVQELLAHHFDKRCRVSAAVAADGSPLELFAISGNRRNDAAFLFRRGLQQTRTPCENYVFRGYVKWLHSARDLRHLAVDVLLQRIPIQPEGKEIRPGVWVCPGARIHHNARVVAPAFVGERARIQNGAAITRCSAIEHHAVITSGTVVENSSVLPYTRVGRCLELSHMVATAGQLVSLRRDVELEINDSRLLSHESPHAPVRAAASLISLATYLPAQFVRGLFATSHSDGLEAPSGVSEKSSRATHAERPPVDGGAVPNEFPGHIAVARRYGNE